MRRFAATAHGAGPPGAERRAHLRIAGVVRTTLYESFGEDADADRLFSYPRSPGVCGEIHVRTRAGRRNATRRRPPARRPRARCGAAGLRRADDERARREEPVPAPRAGADVRGARAAAARARRDRHLRGRRLRRRAADDRDRRPARARRDGARVVGEVVFDTCGSWPPAPFSAGWPCISWRSTSCRAGRWRSAVFAGVPLLLLGSARLLRLVAARAARGARRPDGGAQA